MNIRNFLISLIIFVVCILGVEFDEYSKLDNNSDISIKRDDLPDEFSDEAYETVVDFIQKTRNLDYEWVIYFDYITGEILKCAKGKSDNVNINFKKTDFNDNHVASIHNHPRNLLSPPSDKNFGILTRDFEDYELIAGLENFWIFKVDGVYGELVEEFNKASQTAFLLSSMYCTTRYSNARIFNRMQDIRYGNELTKYINNKNINDIQLVKKEYIIMSNDSTAADYGCRRRITNPETIEILREFESNPHLPSAKDLMYAFYQSMGMDVEYDEIFAD